MKTLFVPLQNVSQYETVLDKMKILLEAGAVAEIDQVNWEDEFSEKMPVSVRVAHNNESIYLYYTVIGEELRAVNTEDFGSVWEDSCVEFFMQREGETGYRNFECNVLGALLSRVHESRDKGVSQTELMSSIYRHSTINHRYQSGRQVSDWSMYLEIPKKALGFKDNESLSGQRIRANFYKCGDKTPKPHYLSWNPIDLPEPNFHVPQFFGLLELE
ncbi:MAG TPA: hypothetical protein DEB12_08685 [Porphyromonadaceae bacterium]|jgi:hypothetical protein|nr:carbohydrate-binding family 9-like protein [Fermentimonas sp.]HBT85962.1 hypothetical protein [Porphyromonadaceae bacterium]